MLGFGVLDLSRFPKIPSPYFFLSNPRQSDCQTRCQTRSISYVGLGKMNQKKRALGDASVSVPELLRHRLEGTG